MSERWTDDFFKLSQPKRREDDGVVVASTTDSDADLRAALREFHEAATDDRVVYTEIGPSIENVDGSIEHSAPRVRSNILERDEDEPCALEKMTLEERMRSAWAYGPQADAARVCTTVKTGRPQLARTCRFQWVQLRRSRN